MVVRHPDDPIESVRAPVPMSELIPLQDQGLPAPLREGLRGHNADDSGADHHDVDVGPHRSTTLRTGVGAPGGPPAADVYPGTPTQVNSSASSGSPRSSDTSLSRNVIPEALAPRA